jgi:hypothetical protein
MRDAEDESAGGVMSADLPTVAEARRNRRVRPAAGPRLFSPAEVAELVDVDEARILRALAGAREELFPHALKDQRGWTIPAVDVRALVGGSLEPLLSLRRFADLTGLSYDAVWRATRRGPEGQPPRLRTVGPAWLGTRRIPAGEYWRFRGDRTRPTA